MAAIFNPPSRWPSMKVGEKNFPKALETSGSRFKASDGSAPVRRKNKGGKRNACMHLGICGGCRN